MGMQLDGRDVERWLDGKKLDEDEDAPKREMAGAALSILINLQVLMSVLIEIVGEKGG